VFPERLKRLRKENDKTQQDIADLLGITQQAVGLYETGKRQPDPAALDKLANYFNTTIDYLVGRTDDPNPPSTNIPLPGIKFFRKLKNLPKESQDQFLRLYEENTKYLEKLAEAERERLDREKQK